jgi:hypothetical protein
MPYHLLQVRDLEPLRSPGHRLRAVVRVGNQGRAACIIPSLHHQAQVGFCHTTTSKLHGTCLQRRHHSSRCRCRTAVHQWNRVFRAISICLIGASNDERCRVIFFLFKLHYCFSFFFSFSFVASCSSPVAVDGSVNYLYGNVDERITMQYLPPAVNQNVCIFVRNHAIGTLFDLERPHAQSAAIHVRVCNFIFLTGSSSPAMIPKLSLYLRRMFSCSYPSYVGIKKEGALPDGS